MVSEGILYIAFGEAFQAEALFSIRSVQEKMPDVAICLMTDQLPVEPPKGRSASN